MNAVSALTTDSFEDHVTQEGIVLVDFWAEWCGPCKAFAPVFEEAATRHPDVSFAKLNVDEEPAVAGALNIRSIPTLMVFRDGVLVFAQPGMLPGKALDTLIEKVGELDMDEVRKEIEKARSQAGGEPTS